MPHKKLTQKERKKEISRIREILNSGKRFTTRELASLRGKIGGLLGADNPGRRKGGLASAKKRWGTKGSSEDFAVVILVLGFLAFFYFMNRDQKASFKTIQPTPEVITTR